jgi:hypothetical protein
VLLSYWYSIIAIALARLSSVLKNVDSLFALTAHNSAHH